uniref:Putative ribonuclease H-like domain-containing protein n=1 Tax=Tanacetum cinerariifolium TaxID=118510 RepID=A0A6L2JZG5_TANCI|nr:putative ribonuclease H-like domain-containing protein [Tanacetum cinerariifolium]
MQKRRNDVKARTTLLLALPDEHQLRFSKHETAKELWEAILKTFGRNEATKKNKKNQLKQHYGNFKAEGSETLGKPLTDCQPIGKGEVHTASVLTASTQVSTASADVAAASISHDTVCAYITSQSNGSQIKYEDITQIDEDDIKEMDIKWNMALLSMRADIFWKKTDKKITIQGTDVASFDKSKVECFNCHKMGYFARECRAPRSQDRGRRETYKQGAKEEEPAPKALMAIDVIGWDWSYMANEKENHALVADDEAPIEFSLMAKSSSSSKNKVKKEKEGLDSKLTGFEYASKDLDTLLGSQRTDKNKEGLGYSAVPPSPAQVYSPPKKDMSWIGLPEFADDTITDYSSPTPSIETDSPTVIKTNKVETARKSSVKYVEIYVSFGQGGGKITGKGINSVLFTDSECIVLGKDFKLKDDTNVLLRTPRQHNMYFIDLNNIVPHKDLTCLVAKAYTDENHLGKFDAKGDEGYFVGYSMSGKAFRVFNNRTKKVEENLHDVASQAVKKDVSSLRYIALPNWFHEAHLESSNSDAQDACNANVTKSIGIFNPTATLKIPPADQMETLTVEFLIPTVSSPILTACLDNSLETSSDSRLISKGVISQEETPSLDNILTLSNRFEDILGDTTNIVDTNGVEADLSNMESIIPTSPTPTFRIHKDHPKSQIIGPVDTPEEPKKIFDALKDPSWEEGIDYEEVFTPVARIKAIRLFLAYASFMGLIVYQMDVKSAFLYGTINEEVYMMQPPGFQDPEFPDRVYKGTIDQTLFIKKNQREFLLVQVYVDDIIFGSLNPQLCKEFKALMNDKFQMSAMGELTFFLGLQVLQKKDGIFLSQNKYVGDILKKFGYSDVRSANTLVDKENPWGKDGLGKDVELHLYRSMIGSLMYLTASRLDIMFAVCACARHQVTPKEGHLYAVKRIFRYLKCHPKLRLWYPKESLFDLVAYSDSDYGGATQYRKLTTRGCQFLERRLISWQCKKKTIMATSTTEAEYVATASGCG